MGRLNELERREGEGETVIYVCVVGGVGLVPFVGEVVRLISYKHANFKQPIDISKDAYNTSSPLWVCLSNHFYLLP